MVKEGVNTLNTVKMTIEDTTFTANFLITQLQLKSKTFSNGTNDERNK